MYLTILVLPLLGSLLSVNRKNGSYAGPRLSFFISILTTLLGTLIWYEVTMGGSPVTLKLTDWIIGGY